MITDPSSQDVSLDIEEKEPVLFIDTTYSQTYGVDFDNPTPRHIPMMQAVKIFVTELSEEDSAAADNASHGAAEEEGGGVLTFTFAGGRGSRLGDLNPGNFEAKTKHLTWAGGTLIMPAIRMWERHFESEFGSKNNPKKEKLPSVCLLVATDGKIDDEHDLMQWINQQDESVTIAFILCGRGDDNIGVINDYTRLANANPRVKVYSLQGNADPQALASQLHAALRG